ncbi:PAS domain-containing protein [Desulforamulus reducens]|nr:PAS domain-containing protein [Desulforamulus reducens]
MIVSMTALVMSLLLLFIFQMGITFYTQAEVLNKLGERREKISLSAQVLTLAEKVISNPDKTESSLSQIEKINTKLLDLVHTTEGKKTVQNMTIAIGNVRHGGNVREIIEAAKDINEFQNRRLGEEITVLEEGIKARGWRAVVISILITIALGIFVVWGISKLGREYLLTKVVMQATSNGILVGNEKGRISVLNNTFCFLLGGCKRSDMIGRPLAEAGEPGRVLALAIHENKFEKGKEIIVKDPNENEVCLLVDTIPWKDEQDKVLGGMAVVRDNTVQWLEKKRVALENQDLREKADRDAMTGLFNYRAFIKQIDRVVSLSEDSFFP